MKNRATAPTPDPVPKRPVVRIVAADPVRARVLADRLEAAGAKLGDVGEADATAVVADGLEPAPSLPGAQLVALCEADTGREPVLPAFAPGALEAWLASVRARAESAARAELAEARAAAAEAKAALAEAQAAAAQERAGFAEAALAVLLGPGAEAVVITDAFGRVRLASARASDLLGRSLEPGDEVGLSVEPGDRIDSTRGRSLRVSVSAVELGEPARMLRISPATGEGGFETRLAHTDRLAQVGAIAAGLAHEVNNPAQTVTADLSEIAEQLRLLDADIARQRLPKEELGLLGRRMREVLELVQACFDGLGRVSGIVRDLKSFSRLVPERVRWVHPNEIVNQACALAHNQIRHRAKLIKELEAHEPVPGDKNRLVQVVTNLLVNAAQATPEEASGAEIRVRTEVRGGAVRIAVLDDGPGIPPEVLDRIFEPFFTTKGKQDGTGLGLALSIDIARQHGGTLEVETSGQGTRFELVLPIDNGLVPEEDEQAAATSDILLRGRVLVVDDEPGIRRSLGRLIGRRHEVEVRGDGRSALELLTEDPSFDVILCDLMMPELDGPGLHAELETTQPALAGRMVFMSGGVFTERCSQFLERAKPRLLDKPASAERLEQVIQDALRRPAEPQRSAQAEGPPTRNFDGVTWRSSPSETPSCRSPR